MLGKNISNGREKNISENYSIKTLFSHLEICNISARLLFLGPPQTRELVVDNYLVIDDKKLSITKKLVCEAIM